MRVCRHRHRSRLVGTAAANGQAPVEWLERLYDALELPVGADTLEYRDARRSISKRVLWAILHWPALYLPAISAARMHCWTSCAMPTWEGPRLGAFSRQPAGAAADRTVCQCMQVKQSRILRAIASGATLNELKATLGCGTVCGSCIPELKQLSDKHKPLQSVGVSKWIQSKVTLLGAGPGDLDLLTIKAVKALAAADVLLIDDLANAGD